MIVLPYVRYNTKRTESLESKLAGSTQSVYVIVEEEKLSITKLLGGRKDTEGVLNK